MNMNDALSFKEKQEKHGLHGHVQIFRRNKQTDEVSLWYESDNIIPISGYQFVLMKMFGLYLDSEHNNGYADIGQDTTLVIPDLNNSNTFGIGISPSNYETMEDDISSRHFVQGFMVGTGGSGEDTITTKNTDYSFINLRNPIPFQQISTGTTLDSSIKENYLGVLNANDDPATRSYFIKKFDTRPHIYHSWWRDGQKWDYVDPVNQEDLGPGSNLAKTNRIETYVQAKMSIDTEIGDCLSYFNHNTSTGTARISELGLVAFDTIPGELSVIRELYNRKIKKMLSIIYDDNSWSVTTINTLIELTEDVLTVLTDENSSIEEKGQSNINAFIESIRGILEIGTSENKITEITADIRSTLKTLQSESELASDDNIKAHPIYDINHNLEAVSDKFLNYISTDEFSDLSTDEAQRIKLVTYYTFNAIPLQENWGIEINYRIYAN